MIKGVVIGEVWATKKVPGIEGRRLKLVAELGRNGFTSTGRVVVAIDTLDANIGDKVMVSFGSGGRNVIEPGSYDNYHILCDCAISQIIDEEEYY